MKMNIEIQNDRKNPLLKRREVRFTVSYPAGTPDRAAVRKELVSNLSSKEKLTVLDYVKPHFGKHEAQGYVKVYDDDEALTVEPAYKIERNFAAPEKKEEASEPSAAADVQPEEGAAEDSNEKKQSSEEAEEASEKSQASESKAAEVGEKKAPQESSGETADEGGED